MSGLKLNGLLASEMEFEAEETLITVTSSIDQPILKFISGDFGPLIAGMPIQLPLWLAIPLRRKGRCKIKFQSG
jgi:GINS complex subunit 2